MQVILSCGIQYQDHYYLKDHYSLWQKSTRVIILGDKKVPASLLLVTKKYQDHYNLPHTVPESLLLTTYSPRIIITCDIQSPDHYYLWHTVPGLLLVTYSTKIIITCDIQYQDYYYLWHTVPGSLLLVTCCLRIIFICDIQSQDSYYLWHTVPGSLLLVTYSPTIIIPPANFVCRGYTVFTLSVRLSVRPCMRPSVTLCFLNILKNQCWIFIKPCKHVHICKTNFLDKKVRARGQFYQSYFPL